ncbi:HAMP domain-containing protein [Candidatus Dependentiae bacterium]|nr:HAMP domain-containing protein [Candidatus Dependentiae bacterium]
MITTSTKRRLQIIFISIAALFVTTWLELFLQRKQNLIGGGINRVFLFLLINFHVVIIVFFLYLIIRQSIKLFVEIHRKTPGSSFKSSLLFAFTVFSVIPSFLVFFVAGKLITTNIDNWFNVRVRNGLVNSLKLHESQTKDLRSDIKTRGEQVFQKLIDNKILKKKFNLKLFKKFIDQTNELKDYNVYIWNDNGYDLFGRLSDEVKIWRKFRRLNDRSTHSLKSKFLKLINDKSVFDFYGSLYFVKKFSFDSLGGLGFLNNNYFVLVRRYPEDIRYSLINIQNAYDDYEQLRSMRNPIYWSYIFTFILITLLILFLSIWSAFYLARGLGRPIQELLNAMQKIRKGKWNVRVDHPSAGDLKDLVLGFNEMTHTIEFAYKQLQLKNKEMFTILENIKEAVFFINKFGRILTYNSASKVLVDKYLSLSRFKNKKINFFGPEVTKIFFKLVRKLSASGKTQLIEEITFTFKSETKVLLVYLIYLNNYFEKPDIKDPKGGLLLIIEDLSDIVKINKIKTWQQAARQLAHEIKNPLTPIQLATQRLQRKFRKKLDEDKAFLESIDTILNQVKTIKDLVAHFSEFAKMPSGINEPIDLNHIINEVVCLYQVSYPEIHFVQHLQEFIPLIKADKQKIKRVLINLLDNAIRALKHDLQNSGMQHLNICEQEKVITIKTRFKMGLNQIELIVADNGPGISQKVKNKLFMPYVSSDKKNTGLGLAIVHENIKQMGGSVKLIPTNKGAVFRILFPI